MFIESEYLILIIDVKVGVKVGFSDKFKDDSEIKLVLLVVFFLVINK